MKIVIPILGFSRSGGSRVLAELASAWVKKGHSVVFFANFQSDPPYFPTDAQVLWFNNSGKRVDGHCSSGTGGRSGIVNVKNNLFSLLKSLNNYAQDCDLVLANHSLTAWPVSFSTVKAKKFFYVQAYEPEYYEFDKGPRAKILRLISVGSFFLNLHKIVNSPVYFNYKYLKASDYVPPGIDYSIFYPKQMNCDLRGRPVRIGCIGRRELQKGTKYVFQAFEIMLDRGYDVELFVAYGNLTESQANHPKCTIIIPKNDYELSDFYRSLDIMVAPGLVQLGAPHYPVMEAMACGVPVITTGYLPASDQNSWIVPVGDAKAIADMAHEAIHNPTLRKQKVDQALDAISVFGWDNVAQQMLDVFQSI